MVYNFFSLPFEILYPIIVKTPGHCSIIITIIRKTCSILFFAVEIFTDNVAVIDIILRIY